MDDLGTKTLSADITAQTDDVELWNPDVAAGISLILSPIFGSIIHAINWRRLGERRREIVSWIWAIVIFVAMFILISLVALAIKDSRTAEQYNGLINIVLCITWYFGAGRFQSKYIAKELKRRYKKRSWFVPICVSVILFGSIVKLGSLLK